jgi:hypothetical protein
MVSLSHLNLILLLVYPPTTKDKKRRERKTLITWLKCIDPFSPFVLTDHS